MPGVRCIVDDVSSVDIILLQQYCGTVVFAMRILQYRGTVVGVTKFTGTFVSDITTPGFDGGNALNEKMAEATRCIIISLDIRLNGMVAWSDLTRSLTVRTTLTCYFWMQSLGLYLEW